MTLLLDAGALYAQADRREPGHADVAALLSAQTGPLVTSAMTATEADYLIMTRLGIDFELAFLEDLASGAFQVECLSQTELATALRVARQYRDLGLGLADASLIVLSQRFQTTRLVSFNQRHFRPIVPLQGGVFTLLPADV